jgi:hypothetical protein
MPHANRQQLACAGADALERRAGRRGIVRMKLGCLHVLQGGGRGLTEGPEVGRTAIDELAARIAQRDHVARAFGDEPKQLLAFAQAALDALALGDLVCQSFMVARQLDRLRLRPAVQLAHPADHPADAQIGGADHAIAGKHGRIVDADAGDPQQSEVERHGEQAGGEARPAPQQPGRHGHADSRQIDNARPRRRREEHHEKQQDVSDKRRPREHEPGPRRGDGTGKQPRVTHVLSLSRSLHSEPGA